MNYGTVVMEELYRDDPAGVNARSAEGEAFLLTLINP